MVLKTTTCRFSGLRIYPGKGIIFVRVDGQQWLFLNRKVKSLYNQRKRPAKLAWTTTYRKMHRKDQEQQVARKKRRSGGKQTARAIGSVSLEVIQKRRTERPEQRKASREAALREVKERMKKSKAEKAASKASAKAAGKAPKTGGPARAPGRVGGKR